MAVVREEKLDFWVKHQLNVLFVGRHGCGKTQMVKETFERNKLKWLYFSASTMDPWVDFVGIPKETKEKLPEEFEIIKNLASFDPALATEWIANNWKMGEKSAQKILEHLDKRKDTPSFLELVRPKAFAFDEVEALFFDELNRSAKKVRNAVMELLQFKSINGKKFNNLKLIWGAINPKEEDGSELNYDVETLDPAQEDRFHIQVEVPSEPCGVWFQKKYGDHTAKIIIDWWKGLNPEQQFKVSPRRIDQALELRQNRGDIRDILPYDCNVSKLISSLSTGHMPDKLETLMKSGDAAAARSFLNNENNYSAAIKYVLNSATMMTFFLPLLAKEKLSVLMSENEECSDYIVKNSDKIPLFRDLCKQIVLANQNRKLVKKIRTALTENQNLATAYAATTKNDVEPDAAYFAVGSKVNYSLSLKLLNQNADLQTAHGRSYIFEQIEQNISEKMSADDALLTLELLSKAVGEMWVKTLQAEAMANLVGIVNHCIAEIARNTGLNWTKIISKHGLRFRALLDKLKEVGWTERIYQPQ